MSKVEIIKYGNKIGVDFSKTHTCYDPSLKGRSCGRCDACIIRINVFKKLGTEDTIEYL